MSNANAVTADTVARLGVQTGTFRDLWGWLCGGFDETPDGSDVPVLLSRSGLERTPVSVDYSIQNADGEYTEVVGSVQNTLWTQLRHLSDVERFKVDWQDYCRQVLGVNESETGIRVVEYPRCQTGSGSPNLDYLVECNFDTGECVFKVKTA